MKSFIRTKIIKGKEYLYEITPYYDPKTKRIRHKSKYLGKNVDGKPVKVRQQIPKSSYNFGEVFPFAKIAEELNLKSLLEKHLSKDEVEKVLAISINRACSPLSLSHIGSWYEGTYLNSKDSPNITSQGISRLLEKIGNSGISQSFISDFIKQIKTIKTLLYDITSVSSYSDGIRLLEYGYNRDGDDLPQINLSLIMDRDLSIPISYELYPGSVVDVNTLSGTKKRLESNGIQECFMVLDRGFFSRKNIIELSKSGFSFVIAASTVLKEVRKVMSNASKNLSDPNNMHVYNDKTLFVSDVLVDIDGEKVSGYCYYIPSRAKDEEERFYRKLNDIKVALESLPVKNDFKERIEEIAGGYGQYFSISKKSDKLEVRFRKNAISQRVNRMGKFILLYKGNLDWKECLSLYRGKDLVEKGFDILKNDIGVYTPQVRKDETLKGLLFVCFLSLIMKMRLYKKIEESGLNRKYSMDGILVELSKLKVIELSNGERILSEVTKKQREIFEKLGYVPNL